MSSILDLKTPHQDTPPALSPRLAEMKRRIRAGEHHPLRTTEEQGNSAPDNMEIRVI